MKITRILFYLLLISSIIFYSCGASESEKTEYVEAVDSTYVSDTTEQMVTIVPPPEENKVEAEENYDFDVTKMIDGRIGYVIDDSMAVNETSRVFMTLSVDDEEIISFLSNQELVYSPGNVDDRDIIFDDIEISKTMYATLIDPAGKFKITPIGDETKVLLFDKYKRSETWMWDVIPQEKGVHVLILNVEVIINENGKEHKSSMVVFNEKISIKSEKIPLGERISKFWSKEWKWLWTTIIIPLALWYYKRRKKE